MKKKLVLLCTFIFLSILKGVAQPIYVNLAATGTGDGTSWADAMTSLDAALLKAKPLDEIWVAKGTYRPKSNMSDHMFYAKSGIKLYGGFSGTESHPNQRNIVANLTILSGDVLGNDVPDNFTVNRWDNAAHVLTIYQGILKTTIDGLSIRDGYVDDPNPIEPFFEPRYCGGGLWCEGTPLLVRSCTFGDNYAFGGGGLFVDIGSEVTIENCTFEKNKCNPIGVGGGIFIYESDVVEIRNCISRNNETVNGSVSIQSCDFVKVDSCQFLSNKALGQFCAGFAAFSSNLELTNSTFKNNTAENAAGLFVGRSNAQDPVYSFNIQDCFFEKNIATKTGGGLGQKGCSGTISNCQFIKNVADERGGGIFNLSIDAGKSEVQVKQCLFDGNFADCGAGISTCCELTTLVVTNCEFVKNNASVCAGGILTEGQVFTWVDSTYFFRNTASGGGAVQVEGAGSTILITNSQFENNRALVQGGALSFLDESYGTVQNCSFTKNTSKYGGAVYAFLDTTTQSNLLIENSTITDNLAHEAGSGIYAKNAALTLSNILLASNRFDSMLQNEGGTLFNIATPGQTASVRAINCDFVYNQSAGIVQVEQGNGKAAISLQNTIFQNPAGKNYHVVAGTPEMSSTGGNLSSDGTFAQFFTAQNDLNNTDPQLEDPDQGLFELKLTSPCIDKGLWSGAPPADLLGRSRINAPDMGCFENQSMSSGVRPISQSGYLLSVLPNPASEYIEIRLENDRQSKATVDIYSVNGQLAQSFSIEKNTAPQSFRLPVGQLPTGTYLVKVALEHEFFSSFFFKI